MTKGEFCRRGNVDTGGWAFSLPMREGIEVNGKFIYLLHDVDELDLDPVGQFDAAV